MKRKKRILSILLCMVMILTVLPVYANSVVQISDASQLPTEIPAGTTYELIADITLANGQQISNLSGVLDGKGHIITLADRPLANNVSGTIQNVGLTGTISDSGIFGSMAVSLSGIIQNSYSQVNLSSNGWDDVGGLVGTLSGGSIYNSYYAGSNSAMFADGLVGYATGGIIANSCYSAGFSVIGMGGNTVTQTNVVKKDINDMKQSDAVNVLNTDIVTTGYKWALSDSGYPVLVVDTGEVVIDKTGLTNTVENVKQLNKSFYTEESWTILENALNSAEIVLTSESVSQKEVNAALSKLEEAINGLEKKRPTEPVAAPTDQSQIVHITSQSQLENCTSLSDSDKYYILDSDISLDNWYWNFDTLQGVFDGNGHTITFHSSGTGLFAKIGKNGVVQNVHFAGALSSSADTGACGMEVQGSIMNCYSEISGSNASGFTKRLNGGLISNCYSISTAEDGVIIEQTETASGSSYTGTLKNVYWQSDLTQPVDLSQLTIQGNTGAVSASAMKTLDFVAALNENKGETGTAWGQSSRGYPYFGANQEYVPESDKPEENKTPIAFTFNGETSATAIMNQQLTVDRNKADDWDIVGVFSLPEFHIPEGAKIEWDTPDVDSKLMDIDRSTGELFAYDDGEGMVTATLVKEDGSSEMLASVKVITYVKEIQEIKLYLADDDGTNEVEIKDGKATVNGSENKRIIVKGKYTDESIYQTISVNDFTFTVTDEADVVKHTDNSSIFCFKAPGKAIMTVAHNTNAQLTKSVELTSDYVKIASVKPGISGVITIHGRNANSSDTSDFLPDYANVIVEPVNASYSGSYMITSSDPTIGEYVDSMVKGYVPHKAGTVTYTATINDNGTEKSGTSEVTYVYQNPLKKITVENDKIILKNGEKVSAGLVFEGTKDAEGYEVTETGMMWSFDKDGIISIVRGNGGFKRDAFAVDNGYYFLSEEYTIKTLSEGTVTVTGIPVDTTSGAEPVTFTVKVEANSDLKKTDIWKMIDDGITISADYLTKDMNNSPVGMMHGYEWHVITLLRAGKDIDEKLLDEYYEAVVKEVKTWDGTEKPTDIERTALALAAMGKDITNIEGVNLTEMIYNSQNLTDGSNELAFALLALDALDTAIPEDAKWDRDSMIEELLKFQNKETGAFGLYDNKEASLDLTAMSIQALAPYQNKADVEKAIEAALGYLKSQISGNYDFDDNSISTAQVLMAAAALKLDITDDTNGFGNGYSNIVTRLDEYGTDTGFRWKEEDKAALTPATYQVMQAFDAYRKAMKENVSYWDFGTPTPDEGENPVVTPTPDEGENPMVAPTPDNGTNPVVTPNAEVGINNTLVNTGDQSSIISWILVMLISGLAVCVIIKKRHKNV